MEEEGRMIKRGEGGRGKVEEDERGKGEREQ